MNLLCLASTCPVILSSKCVFYEGDTLVYTGIGNNETLTSALQKIDAAIGNIPSGGGTWGSITGDINDQLDLIQFLIDNYYPITNPDDYINLSNLIAGTGISITGTYPNITISATGGSATWGAIGGTVTDQTDLITYLASTYTPLVRNLTINGITYDLSADRTWTISGRAPAPASFLGSYKIDTSGIIPPSGSGDIRYNNVTQTSATEIYISHLTDNNIDIDLFLGLLQINDIIVIQDQNLSDNFQFFEISNTPTLALSTWTIPVTLLSSGGTGTTGFANNHEVFLATASVPKQYVQGVTGTSPITVDNTDPYNPIVEIQQASALQDGYLSSTDWSTFDGKGDVFGPASAVDSNFASFDTLTGKLIKDSGYSPSSFAPATGGAYWSLATGGTLTGVNTITSNTPNQLIFNGTWTATANSQYHINFAGSFTGRAAQTTEDYFIYNFNPTLIAGAPSNDFGAAVAIQPTWTGTWSNPTALYIATSGTTARGVYIVNTTGTTNFGYQVIGAGGGISFAADYRGMMTIGNSNFTQGIHGGTGTYSSINDSNIFLTFSVNPATTGTIYRYYLRNSTNGNWVPTAGSTSILRVETTNTAGSRDYAPTSGSHALTVLDLNGLRVNTSGTYTGSIIGIDWNPTITSTTGLATYLAARFTSGSVLIGHTTLGASTTRVQQRGIGTTTGLLHLWEDSAGTQRVTIKDNGQTWVEFQGDNVEGLVYGSSGGRRVSMVINGTSALTGVGGYTSTSTRQWYFGMGNSATVFWESTLTGGFLLRNSGGDTSVTTGFQFSMGSVADNLQATSTSVRRLIYSNTGFLFGVNSADVRWLNVLGTVTNTSSYTSVNGTYIDLRPTINVTGGTTTLRAFYYNPTLTSLTGLTHYAWESTSGAVHITDSARTSNWLSILKTTAGAHTALIAATEFVSQDFTGATWTWADGTVTTQRFNYFRGYTLNKTTTSATFTDAYNVYIDDLTAGTGVTITNKWSLGLAGNLKVVGTRVNMANLPTSSAGLATGDLWNDSGTIKVV